ncbi:MAG: glutamine--fructose-6-phosphate transaminase (isomerizing), partial [Proteobacteria bacterium]|nr:glutamine--fructose-6-phosphate transaminase (isomerizing) [Pseudomonadota bacterium]
MCGIVGYVGKQNAKAILVEGLHRLEYRGYDSAGVAFVRAGRLSVYKAQGKVAQMEALLPGRIGAQIGIGHTRWATHGAPSDVNAHPHTDTQGRVAVIHNGIIENAVALREELIASGIELVSETDTEILAHMIAAADQGNLMDALRKTLMRIHGAYGLAVISQDHPDQIVVARNGSPVVLGIGEKEMFVASDVAALVRHTQKVVYLDDGEIATLKRDGYEVVRLDASPATKTTATVDIDLEAFDKETYAHFTLKEIHDQPEVIERVLRGRCDHRFATARLDGLNLDPKAVLSIRRVKVLGCGSAYIAGSIGARMIESLARIPCDAESAAEFRYRNPIIERDTLYLAVSQSGETFDTLAAVEEIKRKGGTVLGVVNAVGSSIARACSGGVYLHAGAEVAVVSTKTFSATLIVFALIALLLGRTRDVSHAEGERLLKALHELPDLLRGELKREEEFAALAKRYSHFDHAYFIGRNAGYDLATEGALKLKEISYIHAEAYPASELKHGPLALISPTTPTVAIVPDDGLIAKNTATIEEIRSRQGPVLAITQVDDLDKTAQKDGGPLEILKVP